MDLAKLVATCFGDEAKKKWDNGWWKGRLGPLDAFARFVEAEAKKGPVAVGTIDAYCATVSSPPQEEDVKETVLANDEETQKAWAEGRWDQKVSVFGLRKKAEMLGRKLTMADIDKMVADNEARNRLVDEKHDPDAEPMLCEVPSHRGPNEEPSQPLMKYIVYFDKERGRNVRKCHPNGGDPIREGEFLVAGVKIRRYCPKCKTEANSRNKTARKQAFDQMNAGAITKEEIPPRLVWYTAATAKRKVEAIIRSDEAKAETEEFENFSISEHLERRAYNRRRR